MSSNTNQTSPTANQEAMATLAPLYYKTMSATTKEVKKSFIGRNTHDRHSDKVTAVGETNNPPKNEKEKLGQCHRYKIKGKKDSRCKQQATVQPHKGKNKHLVFCEECWEIKRDKNKESCARN